MGTAKREAEQPFTASAATVAVVLCRTAHGNLHTGLRFKRAESVNALHLGWQDLLLNTWDEGGLWAQPDAEPEELLPVATLCDAIIKLAKQGAPMPYALRFAGTTFDSDGKLNLAAGSQGLTCATFVLAVFTSVGLDLIEEATWPTRPEEDRAFLTSLEGFATPQHLALLRAEVDAGVVRIRPDEVLAACALEPPAPFEATRAEADGLLGLLEPS